MITEAKKKYTYADYQKLPEGAPYQLIGGELIMSPSPLFDHQKILRQLLLALADFIERKKLGEVVCAPMDVYLSDEETYQPDIIYISNANRGIIGERIKGAPDLVIEILSESTAYYDLKHKKNVYESSGVKEYWIVDPKEKSVEVFENKNGKYVLFSEAYGTGEMHSEVLENFKMDIGKIF